MKWRTYLKLMCLMFTSMVLAWGVAPAGAQSGEAVQVTSKGEPSVKEMKKLAHQRRQEAKKRLVKALEDRKTMRMSRPGKILPGEGRKGGAE